MSTNKPRTKLRIALVGPGRLGLSLALRHAALGDQVELFGRRPGLWQSAAEAHGVRCQIVEADTSLPALPNTGPWDRLVFSVPDDALLPVSERWAEVFVDQDAPGLLVHASGVADLAVFAAWGEALAAAVHPMSAIQGQAGDAPLPAGAPVTVLASDAQATSLAACLAEDWGGRAIPFQQGADRRRYHLACCLAANHLTALLDWAEQLASPALGQEAARHALHQLAQSALQGIAERGAESALTGPVSRGDRSTIDAHFSALDPSEAARYRSLLPELLGLTERAGRLEAEQIADLAAAWKLASPEPEAD